MHGHATAVLGPVQWAVLLVVAGAVLAYVAGSARLWTRGIGWPLWRLLSWLAGWSCVAVTLVGPLAERAHHDFAVHMATHVVAGMLAPLLLVVAAPVTLVLRALSVARGGPLARALASRPVAVVTHPLTAAVINVGGLWLLYRTGLYAATVTGPWTHLAVSIHVVAAGYLFTFAVLGGPDPAPHRASFAWRAGTLVAAMAAHNILAKLLYADPPVGVPAARAEQASQLMYYGGAPVEIALIALLCSCATRVSVGRRRVRRRAHDQRAVMSSRVAARYEAVTRAELQLIGGWSAGTGDQPGHGAVPRRRTAVTKRELPALWIAACRAPAVASEWNNRCVGG